MSDDSHHSSGLEYLEEDNLDVSSDYDESVASDESEISAGRLATDPDYAVIWELLHSCQEGAFSDIPERYREYLSIFDTEHGVSESEPVNIQSGKEGEAYDGLFEAAGATRTGSEPWSLPAVTRHLSQEDAHRSPIVRVLNVAHVIPTAAVYLMPNAALFSTNNESRRTSEAAVSASTTEFSTFLESSISPLVHATEPLFASAVFTSASQISHRREQPSFYTLWRYNRLAATSLLRQAHSFHIDIPVFGVLLRGNLVAFHIDWYEERDGVVLSNSALYTLNDQQENLKIWDLRQPADARDVGIILANLRRYTSGPYALRVRKALNSVEGPVKPWKWDASRLPKALTYTSLESHAVEPDQDKMGGWLADIQISMEHEKRGAWLRRKWNVERLAERDFLSPPSTPESPEKLRT